MDNSCRIKEFISKTGAETIVAKKVLQEHDWNLEKAVKAYNVIQTAALPPIGPHKNALSNQQLNEQGNSNHLFGGKSASPNNTLEVRKLKRGLSKTTDNVLLVNKARESVLSDIVETSDDEQYFVDTPEYTFILPDLTKFSEDFRDFLQKDLIETATLVSLEQAGRLNWWADIGVCSRLLPLATTGDGNCLLHAASLGMWGFHDRQLTLRHALFKTLNCDSGNSAFWRRWRWHQTQVNKQSGLMLSEKEWEAEWTSLLKLASTVPRTQPGRDYSSSHSAAGKSMIEADQNGTAEECEVFYESLEEFHVFVLAHVLRRPIIVVADTVLKNSSGEALAPIPFGGIYLPLESKPERCHRSPLLLTYDAAHFSALVPMDREAGTEDGSKPIAGIPVVGPELELLPIHFLVDPGPQFVWNQDELDLSKVKELEPDTGEKLHYIQDYLDLIKVPIGQTLCVDGSSENNGSRSRSSSWSATKEATLHSSMSVESSESSQSGSNSNSNTSVNKATTSADTETKNNSSNNDKEKKDKTKGSKQMHSVVKSFGSIGKTMSKKLKSLSSAKYISKGDSDKKQSPVTPTLSTGVLSVNMLMDKENVLCAKLLHKRLDYQEEMIQNYLDEAQRNFEQERDLRQKQSEEFERIAERHRLEQETMVPCINTGCKELGTPAMSYLCKECYNKQRKQALDMEKDIDRAGLDSSVERESRKSTTVSDLQRQNTLVSFGSSKFYTYVEEDQSLTQPKYGQTSNNVLQPHTDLNNSYNNIVDKVKKAPLELARSSFYNDSGSTQMKTSSKVTPLGTARIINNLQDEQLITQLFEESEASSHHTSSQQNDRPKPIVENHQNIINLSMPDYSNRPLLYGPKVPNTSEDQQKEVQVHRVNKANPSVYAVGSSSNLSPTSDSLNAKPHYVVNSSNIHGKFMSRIDVGSSPSCECIPQQKCRSSNCQNVGSDDKEYYCTKCYQNYLRNRTTFLV